MLEARQLAGGWGSRRESWQRTGRAQPGHRASDAGVLIKALPLRPSTPALSQQPSVVLFSPLPPPPPSLPGPWIMSTGELENRTLVCFASLAPSRQHQLPAAEEGAALGWLAFPPHLGQTDKRQAFLPCLASPPPDPLGPCVHRPLRAWVRVQEVLGEGTLPIPG